MALRARHNPSYRESFGTTMAQAPMRTKSGTAPTDAAEAVVTRRGRSAAVAADATALAARAFARKGFADPALVLHWSEIAGPEVARLAVPVKLSNGPSGATLTLKADPGAALFLQHESRQLCARINAWAGQQLVSRLRFVQGPLARPPKVRAARRACAPSPADPAWHFAGDEGLKAALLALAAWRRGD